MNKNVLFVDDEANVLDAVRRKLRKKFNISTALSGAEALEIIKEKGPFAVLVTDMRMPEMNGVQLLNRVKEIAPNTVRMMLTGNADQETAIQAVNEGSIFRFFNKPCPPELLENGVAGAIEQYRLVTAEKELLNKTLNGSIKVLTEILSLVNPAAFSRSYRIRNYVQEIAIQLQLPNLWQFQIAALLSQIGCVTLPGDTVEKMYKGVRLEKHEAIMYRSHPKAGARLLANISGFGVIAEMIALQLKPYSSLSSAPDGSNVKMSHLGAEILHVALDYDKLTFQGHSHQIACEQLAGRTGKYNPKILEVLKEIEGDGVERITRHLDVMSLKSGMIVDQDILAKNGLLLASKGQEISNAVIARLRNFSVSVGVEEPFRIVIVRKKLKSNKRKTF